MKISGPPGEFHSNGNSGAAHVIEAAPSSRSPQQPNRTTFAPDHAHNRGRALAYAICRYQLGNVPPLRYIFILLVGGAAVWASGLLPGRWIGVTAFMLLFLLILYVRARLSKQDFVEFTPADKEIHVTPSSLTTSEKIDVYAAGLFSVEGKFQRFTLLPGFYRTFATGEHAIMCLVRPRKFLGVAKWPEDEVGMWYIFFMPSQICDVQAGNLHFACHQPHAVAINYEVTLPAQSRFSSETTVIETVYVLTPNAEEQMRIMADLQMNRHGSRHESTLTPATTAL